jgi:hypothetical protein
MIMGCVYQRMIKLDYYIIMASILLISLKINKISHLEDTATTIGFGCFKIMVVCI